MTRKKPVKDIQPVSEPTWGDWVESGNVIFCENLKWKRAISYCREKHQTDEHGALVLVDFEVRTEIKDA